MLCSTGIAIRLCLPSGIPSHDPLDQCPIVSVIASHPVAPGGRLTRSNPEFRGGGSLDCFVADASRNDAYCDFPIRISNSVLVGLAFGASWFETALARLLTMRVRRLVPLVSDRHPEEPRRSAASRRIGHDKIVDTTSRSRGAWRPSFSTNSPSSETEGAGKTGCPSHPWSACNKKARGRTTGTSRTTGLPCAVVLRLIRDLPGDQALLSPSPTIVLST